ncbi:ketoacyl-ACP synthase III [Maricaulis sp.]|uniref:ketoacyl-ACP synthase III n=1 Tax=Maricaulis sp. TaxID=1486257 RepID=UPI00261E11AC|nr:ketoacyl-ACP synthase III [Maricaulis sp.]
MTSQRTWIRSIGTRLGSARVDNVRQAETFGKDAEFLDTRIGARWLPQADDTETAVTLGEAASREAIEEAGIAPERIGILIFVSQNPDFGGLPHNSAILQDRLGLPTSSACFDVGLGCSGYVYALSIATAMMQALRLDQGLIVTSDQYRAQLREGDVNTQMLFGDGATATVLSRDEAELEIVATELGTNGNHASALQRSANCIAMNGRTIFGFSRKTVPLAIRQFTERYGLSLDEVDTVLLHQGSRAIVEEITKELGLDVTKVPIEMGETGNTVSSSIPFLLKPRLKDCEIKTVLATGFGVGLSWGTAWMRRTS